MASFIRKVPTASGARARLLPGQDTLDLTSRSVTSSMSTSSGAGAGAQVARMSSRLLRDVLAGAYQRLGFAVVGDETFKRLVLARIIEPTSTADTIRVLDEIGVAHSARGGQVAMVLYDVTTLHLPGRDQDPHPRAERVRAGA